MPERGRTARNRGERAAGAWLSGSVVLTADAGGGLAVHGDGPRAAARRLRVDAATVQWRFRVRR